MGQTAKRVEVTADEESWRAALKRVLGSREFQKSERARSFLTFVVNETLAGHAIRIKQRTIAIEVFDRPDDFDQHNDSVVRVTAAHVRRRLKSYYTDEGNSDPVVIEIPKGTYVPVFSRITPPKEPVRVVQSLQRPVVAVMPFEARNNEDITKMLADGVPMEISSELARYTNLAVVSFSSTRHHRPESTNLLEAGASLGADFLITGQIIATQATCRVSVQVNEAKQTIQLWTRRYDFPLNTDSIGHIEDVVVQSLLSQLGGRFGAIPQAMVQSSKRAMPREMTAYQGLLQYYQYMGNLTPESCLLARDALEQAIALEPDNAAVLASLATVYLDDVAFSFLGGQRDSLDLGRNYARQAVTTDSLCADAYESLAFSSLLDGDAPAVARAADTMLQLSPGNAYLVGSAGLYFATAGRVERGAELVRRSIALNPSYPTWFNVVLFLDHYLRGSYDEALFEAEKVHQPSLFWDPLVRAAALGKLGRPGAHGAIEELDRLAPDFWHDPHSLMKCLFLDPKVRDLLLEGLELARDQATSS